MSPMQVCSGPFLAPLEGIVLEAPRPPLLPATSVTAATHMGLASSEPTRPVSESALPPLQGSFLGVASLSPSPLQGAEVRVMTEGPCQFTPLGMNGGGPMVPPPAVASAVVYSQTASLAANGLLHRYEIYRKYAVWIVLDVMITLGSILLLLCYAVARHYHHVGVFCDISDLVVHMPERVVFRFNFACVGAALVAMAYPVHDIAARRVCGRLPGIGALLQQLSGIGVILVGACGPEECKWFHGFAAILGFAGSGIAQVLYALVFAGEDQPKPQAVMLFAVRCCITMCFLLCAVIYGLNAAGVVPQPWGHITEWGMWWFLLLWYWTFRVDMASPGEYFYLATIRTLDAGFHRQLRI